MSHHTDKIILFSLADHPLSELLITGLNCAKGELEQRHFPDGEFYLRVLSSVSAARCIVLADLSHPNSKYLPIIFLANTLRELGAASVGLLAPYLCYMRQDRRFIEGEALTSKLFAADLCRYIDWLVTVDPHLHRYHSLSEIYSLPNRVVKGSPALAAWLKSRENLLLVGPDAESEQWVSEIADCSGHPYAIGEKKRFGDRDVKVILPELGCHGKKTAVIIDDVISSGQTILHCIDALRAQGFDRILCAAIHGIFADNSDEALLKAGLSQLITTNTLPHHTNRIDVSELLIEPIRQCLAITP